MPSLRRTLLLALLCVLALAAPAHAQTLWAVGDGADDGTDDDALAGRIQSSGVDKFLYLGDVYENGTAVEFAQWYEPGFGRMKAITAPTPGNHEWANRAQGYDPYWGADVMQPNGGHYYSFDLGGFHFVSLNSEEDSSGSSAQAAWLRRDLANYPGTCTIAISHKPRYSAGPQGDTPSMEDLWGVLSGHAVALISGHVHNYQRHRPNRGITQFVVGTGGHEVSSPNALDPRLARSVAGEVGALRLRLTPGTVSYDFSTVEGETDDRGVLECRPHGPVAARISVSRPKNRGRYRAVRTVSGRSANTRRLRFSLIRRRGGRCDVWTGGTVRRGSCSSRRSFAIRNVRRWRTSLRGGLPAGTYRLTLLARSVDGTLTRRVTRFKVVKRR
jgi:hypothetical protein